MPPWIAQVTFDTQTVLIVVGVIAGVVIVGCLLYMLYDQPPDSEPLKPKTPSLPYASPPPPGGTLGPRFAQIEAWEREQEGGRPFLPGVPRLGAAPPASSAPPAADVTEAADPAEADWLNDRARPFASEAASPSAVPASAGQPPAVAPEQPEAEPDEAPEASPAREAVPATASDSAAAEMPSLRPVQPDVLAELELRHRQRRKGSVSRWR